jgi:PTH1 family peptidyl-tRNA hydrolase
MKRDLEYVMNEIYLIGLGNPGKKYSKNRHNIGFLLLEKLSKKYNSNFIRKDKLKSYYSEFKVNDSTYRLFLPNTFMNNSGDAVRAIVDWYKINLDQIFIIVDDKDLPLGKIRFRKKGSSGGHNGLKSIIEKLQTNHFNRIRIGIGSPRSVEATNKLNTISHVLGNISLEENSILDRVFKKVIESLEQLSTKKEEYIINELNSFDKDHI